MPNKIDWKVAAFAAVLTFGPTVIGTRMYVESSRRADHDRQYNMGYQAAHAERDYAVRAHIEMIESLKERIAELESDHSGTTSHSADANAPGL